MLFQVTRTTQPGVCPALPQAAMVCGCRKESLPHNPIPSNPQWAGSKWLPSDLHGLADAPGPVRDPAMPPPRPHQGFIVVGVPADMRGLGVVAGELAAD